MFVAEDLQCVFFFLSAVRLYVLLDLHLPYTTLPNSLSPSLPQLLTFLNLGRKPTSSPWPLNPIEINTASSSALWLSVSFLCCPLCVYWIVSIYRSCAALWSTSPLWIQQAREFDFQISLIVTRCSLSRSGHNEALYALKQNAFGGQFNGLTT